jgi:hypothetical protein
MSWASKRKILYITLLIFVIGVVTAPLVYIYYPRPTCTDGKQNQNEVGIDCGGPCTKVCKVPGPKVLWTRSFKVASGVYAATTLISNPNASLNLIARSVPYQFRLYDSENVLVAERKGVLTIPALSSFPIFEGGISTGHRDATKASFVFTEDPQWEHGVEAKRLKVSNTVLTDAQTAPKLSAELTNTSATDFSNVHVIAVLFDDRGNAIGSSETFIDQIASQKTTPVFFTWPIPFAQNPSRIEIYPDLLPETQ